ncbi:MAG: hypothetical protein U0936_24040 [Planctomycetaceae bacterium]
MASGYSIVIKQRPILPVPVPPIVSGFNFARDRTISLTGHTEWVDGKIHETGFTTTFTPNAKTIIAAAFRQQPQRRGEHHLLAKNETLDCRSRFMQKSRTPVVFIGNCVSVADGWICASIARNTI